MTIPINVRVLRPYIGRSQLHVITENTRGEEGQWFKDKIDELAKLVEAMPKTGDTDGQGDSAIACLHYFKGGADWWITEKDIDTDGEGQIQAFGLADLFGDGGELGYISISELLENGVELDLHWTPKPLKEVRRTCDALLPPAKLTEAEAQAAKSVGVSIVEPPSSRNPVINILIDIPTGTREQQFIVEIEALLTNIRARASSQFRYNEETNIPAGIIAPDDSVWQAIRQGVAGAWNQSHGWDCEAAIEMAHALLEDANCHTEAQRLRGEHQAKTFIQF